MPASAPAPVTRDELVDLEERLGRALADHRLALGLVGGQAADLAASLAEDVTRLEDRLAELERERQADAGLERAPSRLARLVDRRRRPTA